MRDLPDLIEEYAGDSTIHTARVRQGVGRAARQFPAEWPTAREHVAAAERDALAASRNGHPVVVEVRAALTASTLLILARYRDGFRTVQASTLSLNDTAAQVPKETAAPARYRQRNPARRRSSRRTVTA